MVRPQVPAPSARYGPTPSARKASFALTVMQGMRDGIGPEDEQQRLMTHVITQNGGPCDEGPFLGQLVELPGPSAESLQLAIVSSADVVCLGAGARGTLTLYKFARGLDRPVLPLPFLGKSSRRLWDKHKKEICRQLGIEEETANAWGAVLLTRLSDEDMIALASDVAHVLLRAVRRRCLVFMPFAPAFDWVFERLIREAARQAGVDMVRLDLEQYTGDIASKFRAELRTVDFTVAVITGDNPSVHYEIGYAHALGKPVLLVAEQEPARRALTLPLYVRNHRTIWYTGHDSKDVNSVVSELAEAFRSIGV